MEAEDQFEQVSNKFKREVELLSLRAVTNKTRKWEEQGWVGSKAAGDG